MKSASTLFKQYSVAPDRTIEVKAVVGVTEYTNDSIVEFIIDESSIVSDEFTIGTVISSKMIAKLKTADVLPANAKIQMYLRMLGISGYTEWLPIGVFYIDNRTYQNDLWSFECFDKLITTNQLFVSGLTYPETMQNVWNELMTQLTFNCDSSVIIDPTHMIPYKDEDITMRDMMAYIAMAQGASVRLTGDENICFINIPTANTEVILPSEYVSCVETNPLKSYTKIILTYNSDGETITEGTGTVEQTLSIYNPFMTEAMLKALLTKISTFSYIPFEMSWKHRPYLDVGDYVKIRRTDATEFATVLLQNTITYKGGLKASSKAPSVSAQKSEFNYVGRLAKIIKESSGGIQEDEPYFGVTIGRANGLKIEKSDNSSQTIINSDTWQASMNGVRKLWMDFATGKMVFDGDLSANLINALSAIITPNLYAGKATIAELTVDQLDTSTKVQNYLSSLKTDVNYIRIKNQYVEFITAEYVGDIGGVAQTEQAVNRDNAPLYWTDETQTASTTEETAWEVTVYQYAEMVKMSYAFEEVDGVYRPHMVLGTGWGDETYPERGKFFIDKDLDGGLLKYITSAGVEHSIHIGEDGILFGGQDKLSQLDFYANGFIANYGNETVGYRWTKDVNGRITNLEDIYDGYDVTVNWNGGNI